MKTTTPDLETNAETKPRKKTVPNVKNETKPEIKIKPKTKPIPKQQI